MFSTSFKSKVILLIIFSFNVVFWSASNHVRMPWSGVPAVPSKNTATAITLGDDQFFYRYSALNLQNVGDTGGRKQSFENYNYNTLKNWFDLLNSIDSKSNHIPMAAAYYFGATKEPEKIKVIIDYLAKAGADEDGDKWRWLAHAAFLARFKLKDIDYALELAYKLSSMDPIGDSLPLWARHMPAFVLTEMKEKDAAIALMEGVLLTDDNIHATERNFIYDYLINRLGVDEGEVGSSLTSKP